MTRPWLSALILVVLIGSTLFVTSGSVLGPAMILIYVILAILGFVAMMAGILGYRNPKP